MATPRPVLIIDDDVAVRDTLLDQLAIDGEFTPVAAESAAAADRLLALEEQRFDAILLDIGLPDCDGREYCAKLRKAGVSVPIIMLTGAGAEQDVVRGLDSGANDYIAKPFRLNELLHGSGRNCGCLTALNTRFLPWDLTSSAPPPSSWWRLAETGKFA